MWDVDSAYLHRKIEHKLYVDLPEGYRRPGKAGKFNKALYGLSKAVQLRHKDLEDKLKSLGFTPLRSDTGVSLNKSLTIFMAIDVDDQTGICSSEEELRLKAVIQKFYKIK